MSAPSTCPRCGTARLVTGSTTRVPVRFVANSASFGPLRLGVPIDSWLHACGECGLVFSELSVNDLTDQLSRLADARVKAWLQAKPNRPL
jgi:hypothetical protein